MDGYTLLLLVLTAVLALITGAGIAVMRLRPVLAGLRNEVDDAGTRLGAAVSARAAAEAENRLLHAQNRQLLEQSGQDQSVLRAIAPLADKLGQVQAHVGQLERERAHQFGQLAQQLHEAQLSDSKLLSTTHSLASALRSTTARGQWGEVQLRRIVEAAGMLPRVDFVEQATLTIASREGTNTARPDMVIQLPGNKQIVVDSKVPLDAYLEAQAVPAREDQEGGAEEARRRELLAQHVKAVRAHVDALARKKYWEGADNSPDLVVCFLPLESVLSSALQTDPALLDYAFTRNVVLASPVSLLAILKGVAFSWRQDVLTENAKELYDLSRELYERLGTMGSHITRLGSSLKSSVEKYNSFVGTLESRVLPTARRINAFEGAGNDSDLATGAVEATPRLLSAPELIDSGETTEPRTEQVNRSA
ncbi:DNA recombination protein RmuC [Arthrobacter subterraneus]|uniref:DNA recombination protein RmuC n=1 Tax=Arthrobacter subterraneus TaxID=335973 RepID=A0A1G8C4D4_9MICC|nr:MULTISPECIES: DNA recombination protein RmuC [Arthrobacter]SDH40159.1 DNA recombination protein RmuC [Arthrobacter subterraneus]